MHTIRTACGSFFTMTNKPSRNINEQISLLKSRGMLFQDESAAKNLLKSISYYRLKGYWWDISLHKLGFNNQWQQENIWK